MLKEIGSLFVRGNKCPGREKTVALRNLLIWQGWCLQGAALWEGMAAGPLSQHPPGDTQHQGEQMAPRTGFGGEGVRGLWHTSAPSPGRGWHRMG